MSGLRLSVYIVCVCTVIKLHEEKGHILVNIEAQVLRIFPKSVYFRAKMLAVREKAVGCRVETSPRIEQVYTALPPAIYRICIHRVYN